MEFENHWIKKSWTLRTHSISDNNREDFEVQKVIFCRPVPEYSITVDGILLPFRCENERGHDYDPEGQLTYLLVEQNGDHYVRIGIAIIDCKVRIIEENRVLKPRFSILSLELPAERRTIQLG